MKILLKDIDSNHCRHLEQEGVRDLALDICVVGIGNPLHISDSMGLLVVSGLKERLGDQVCCLNLELYCQFLKEIIQSHRTVVIVDAVVNLDSKDSVLLEIDKATLDGSHRPISASHGVSWMDELKLINIESNNVFFFGVSGDPDSQLEEEDLVRYVDKLEEVIDLLSKQKPVKCLTERI